jgi:hypothetical protein
MKTILLLMALAVPTVWAIQNDDLLMASALPLVVKPDGSANEAEVSTKNGLEPNKWAQTNIMPNVPGVTNWPVTNLPPTTNWPSTNLPAMTNPPALQPPGGK